MLTMLNAARNPLTYGLHRLQGQSTGFHFLRNFLKLPKELAFFNFLETITNSWT